MYFGIIMVLNPTIGLLTLPTGMVLFVLARVAEISFEDCVRACLPGLVPLLLVVVITFVSETLLWPLRPLQEHGYL